MKKKIVILIILMLFITTSIVTVAGKSLISIVKNNNASGSIFLREKYAVDLHGTLDTSDDFLIDLIQQMNETLYLGYLENITAFGPRVTGTGACGEAGDYIYNEFKNMGLNVRYHYWNYSGYSDRNIEATLFGNNETCDAVYIICGHYDTVANCPGADDDASGVSTVLSAAFILHKYSFNYTIRFVAFSGEEQWMLGSHEYAREAYENGDNIIAVLNVDMIGFAITSTQGSYIKIYKNDASKWISDFTINISQEYYDYISLEVIPLGESPSDQLYFWNYGYDGVFYHEYEFNYYYHTSQDTIENMNITYVTKCSKLILATLAELSVPFQPEVNLPPNTPAIDGPTSGDAGTKYNYTFNSVDPDDDDVYYYILWGDGHVEVWKGPHPSGVDFEITHTYKYKGTYTIKAKAKDSKGAESEWETLTITMPKNKTLTNMLFLQLLHNFLQNHPSLFLILQKIIQRVRLG